MSFSLACNVFTSFNIFGVVVVDDTRRYEPLNAKQNFGTVKGYDHPNSIFCGTLHFHDELLSPSTTYTGMVNSNGQHDNRWLTRA